jgi:hypothetical protein
MRGHLNAAHLLCPEIQCKDCGTGYCQHERQENKCKNCGTGYCQQGRQKSCCRDSSGAGDLSNLNPFFYIKLSI